MSESVQSARRSRAWVIAAVLVFFCFAAAVVWRTRRTAPSATNDGDWITPVTRMLKVQVNATGIVRLKTGAEVRVGAQLSGIVHRLFVTVGSKVGRGQVIAEIDPRPVQAMVQQARAHLAQARVTLAKAAVDQGRSRQLFKAGVISKQQFQDADASLDATQGVGAVR